MKVAVRSLIDRVGRRLENRGAQPHVVIREVNQEEVPLMVQDSDEIPLRMRHPLTPNNSESVSESNSLPHANPAQNLAIPTENCRKLSNASSTHSSIPGDLEIEDEIVEGYETGETEMSSRIKGESLDEDSEKRAQIEGECPRIEIESPSTASSPLKTAKDSDLSEEVDVSLGLGSSLMSNQGEVSIPALGCATADGAGSSSLLIPGKK